MTKKRVMCSSKDYESGAGIVLVKVSELHDFKDHPFKVEQNQELFELILSILVDTFISKISLPMQPVPEIRSISGA